MKRGAIFIGGLIGTGKSSLAKALAEKLNIPYIDVDKFKKEVYSTDPNFEYNLKNNIPFSEETRIKTFNKAVESFSRLSRNNNYIVVEEVLSRKVLRKVFFDAAKKYFGDYLMIWIQVDESIVKERLEASPRQGHLLKNPFGMYLSIKKEFEDVEPSDIVFENNGDFNSSLLKLLEIVKAKIID